MSTLPFRSKILRWKLGSVRNSRRTGDGLPSPKLPEAAIADFQISTRAVVDIEISSDGRVLYAATKRAGVFRYEKK